VLERVWEWLPGFSGTNDAILSMFFKPNQNSAGPFNVDDGALFLSGIFTNYPSVAVWSSDPKVGIAVLPVTGAHHNVTGYVTSITWMKIPPQDRPLPGGVTQDYTWMVVTTCMLVGIGLGVLSAFFCHYHTYVPWLRAIAEGKQGIALQTLSYGVAPDLDIAESYNRGMQARHLGNAHSLTIIDPSEIVLHNIIGEGSFGRVWSAMWQSSQVAVKEFVFAQAAVSGGSLHRRDIIEEIVGEAGIMSYLRHPRILQLFGCSLTAQAIWLVSELCSLGSLRQVLDDKHRELPISTRIQMAIDVAEGMLYLHSRDPPIIHRDIKSHNLFVQESPSGEYCVKIGDWGSARAVALAGQQNPKTMTHGVGTVCWLAPEVIKHGKGSERIDVYSFGVVLWELATRHEVHATLTAAQIIARVANEGLRPPVPRGCPWANTMQACWHEDPAGRPSFDQILDGLQDLLPPRGLADRGGSAAAGVTAEGNWEQGDMGRTGQYHGARDMPQTQQLEERTPLL